MMPNLFENGKFSFFSHFETNLPLLSLAHIKCALVYIYITTFFFSIKNIVVYLYKINTQYYDNR